VKKNSECITQLLIKQSEEFNWSGIEFPAGWKDISKFEKNNNVSIHVFGYEKLGYGEREVIPLRTSAYVSQKVVDLLLISEGDTKHYCWIKNFNRLMAIDGNHNAMHYCRRCLNCFTSKEALSNHNEYCSQHDVQKIVMPKLGTMLKFKNYCRSMRVPFVVYADFESTIVPIDVCQPDPSGSYTKQYQKHIPSSFCYYIVCFDDSIYSHVPVTYTAKSEDDDVAQIFLDSLEADIKKIYNKFKFPKKMIPTQKDLDDFEAATTCQICSEGDFVFENNHEKVRS
jgi:hypothetical protein